MIDLMVIAGRGATQSMNWGVKIDGYPKEVIDRWEKNLKPYVGKKVILSGGGSWGSEEVVLEKVWQEQWNEKNTGLRVRLKTIHRKGEDFFEPWIDSWQISVVKRANKTKRNSG